MQTKTTFERISIRFDGFIVWKMTGYENEVNMNCFERRKKETMIAREILAFVLRTVF